MSPDNSPIVTAEEGLPISLADFRQRAFVSESDYNDELIQPRIRSAANLVEERTGLKLIRGTYDYTWKEFPKAKYRDQPLTVVGFHATNPTVFTVNKEGVETAFTEFYSGPVTDVGSVELYPQNDYRWNTPNDTAFVRVKLTAGCDLQNNLILGDFIEAVAMAFRYLYDGAEEVASNAVDDMLSKWVIAGGKT